MAANPAYRETLCRYWTNSHAGCHNRADGTVHHDFHGEIPTCRRCANLVGLTLNEYGAS